MRLGFAFFVAAVCLSIGAGPKPAEPEDSTEQQPMCYFPQAPPSVKGLALYACEQLYAIDPPAQCCLYVSADTCAVLCNVPTGPEPLMFKGKPVPCPGTQAAPEAPGVTL